MSITPYKKETKLNITNFFEFENKPFLIIVDNDKKIWFKGVDVARILDYADPSDIIYRNVSKKYRIKFVDMKISNSIRYREIHPSTTFIDEPGLYRLIIRSNMPKAEKFTDWVVEEVLPSIRKTGQYSLENEEIEYLIKINEKFLEMMAEKDKLLSKKDEMIEQCVATVNNTQNTLNKVLPHYSPLAKNVDKTNTFVIIEKNKPDEKYQYYAIRIQFGSLQNRLNELKQRYPNFQILLQLDNDPNAVKLYNLMKEEFEGNHFNTNISKNRLIHTIYSIYSDIFKKVKLGQK
jgi:prophage antirepressor-like protein